MVFLPLIQVNDLPGFPNFEIDRSLAKLFSQTRKQLTCFAHAVGGDKDLQAIACLFIDPTIIRDPSAFKRALQGILQMYRGPDSTVPAVRAG